MNYGIVKPVLIAFFISVLLSPMMIRYLHKLKFGQFIRGEGPESHLKKSGTPTMGGLIILLGIVIASLFYEKEPGTAGLAEDVWADHSHRNLCVLFDKLHADRNFDADSFYTW